MSGEEMAALRDGLWFADQRVNRFDGLDRIFQVQLRLE